jgi:hypothetical protein
MKLPDKSTYSIWPMTLNGHLLPSGNFRSYDRVTDHIV